MVTLAKDMKEKVRRDMSDLPNLRDVQVKLELVFMKLQEEVINPSLIHSPTAIDAKNQNFPSSIQNDNLFNVIRVDEVRRRINSSGEDLKKLRVLSLVTYRK
jgi:hypothetical protein